MQTLETVHERVEKWGAYILLYTLENGKVQIRYRKHDWGNYSHIVVDECFNVRLFDSTDDALHWLILKTHELEYNQDFYKFIKSRDYML